MAKFLSTLVLLAALPLAAQEYGSRLGEVKRGGRVSFEPTGPGVLFDALDPVLRKWYVPQELYNEYRWRQDQYSNYARENYQRYVSTSLEGNYFYDVYGNFLTRGWLVFDWRQQNPQPFGSSLYKDGRLGSWFNNVVVAADHKGQYHYALTLADQLRTTLTPLSFSKTVFNGAQLDVVSDKYAGTLLLSRISEPNFSGGGTAEIAGRRTHNTNLLGTRLQAQVGDFVEVGATFVNAHHAQTQAEAFGGSLFRGTLTGVQNLFPASSLQVLIRDDSPEDGEAGGALFASDILIWDVEGNLVRGSEIGFRPLVEGGFQRRGYLAAEGNEVIRLTYDFFARTYTGPDPTRIRRVQMELVLADDYRVEILSDRQVDAQNNEVPLPVARASGNVKDSSNQRVLLIDYGLPTASQVAGFSVELADLYGFAGYLELNLNHRFSHYPNPGAATHHTAATRAQAWMLNLSRISNPYFAHLEAFALDPDYDTGFSTVDERGVVDYDAEFQRYEFVEDNDDQDRLPDWRRKGWTSGDREVFPGWDENNDFLSDFNQNDSEASPNLVPDYEEPFLRFNVDRPEFLYGVDMNHNGTIDRFENDQEADYPYPRDRRGYNLYGGAFLGPDIRLMLGRQRVEQIADDRRGWADYLVLTVDRSLDRGRVRLFQDLRRVRDTIRDDLLQWVQTPNTRGELVPTQDLLPAPNTWVNSTYLGGEHHPLGRLVLRHTLKWQLYHQRDQREELSQRRQRRNSSFLGWIGKAEYPLALGPFTLAPAWKLEFRRQTPVLERQARRRELSQLFLLSGRLPLMQQSALEAGLEYHRFSQLEDPVPPGADDDLRELSGVVQMTNLSSYQGYRLTTILGIDLTRQHFAVEATRTRTRGFLTIYAGVER
ncbi:MAG: hypothetical protein FJY95_22515 [Candidatus Handelsmanbacteria bacterium]|nr:hypothetical protein [Candidatus Handelsmanbacteria bacterium]